MTTSEIIISISSGVQAITTIVLVRITYKQMIQAQKSVESMERSIKADFLPVLMLGFTAYSSTNTTLNITLTNCGKGLAKKPKVIFPGQPDIIINSLNVGESDNVTINYNMQYILTKIDVRDRKIIIEYQDVFGRKIITEADLVKHEKLGPSGDESGIAWESWTPIIP
jgi:archaellum component FlaF (FlaF/FlaG flagellin family)